MVSGLRYSAVMRRIWSEMPLYLPVYPDRRMAVVVIRPTGATTLPMMLVMLLDACGVSGTGMEIYAAGWIVKIVTSGGQQKRICGPIMPMPRVV